MARLLESEVRRRASDVCEYCRIPQTAETATFVADHIIARQHGGPTAASNLALACFFCNTHKGPNIAGVDPRTRKIVRLFHPRLHKWSAHFAWNGAELIGRTAIGRATIVVLAIKFEERLLIREVLMDEGLFFV